MNFALKIEIQKKAGKHILNWLTKSMGQGGGWPGSTVYCVLTFTGIRKKTKKNKQSQYTVLMGST